MSDSSYGDSRIEVSDGTLRIRGYYFPWGTKSIPCGAIHSIRQVNLGALTGRARIWGTANPRFWANLDPSRPRKRTGFVLDLGRSVRPFVTPDDPGTFARALEAAAGVPVERGDRPTIL